MNFSIEKICGLLSEKEIISKEKLQLAIKNSKNSSNTFQKYIIKNNWISENDFLTYIAELYNLPFVQMDSYLIDKSIVNSLPLSLAKKYNVMPIVKIGNELAVAMADPINVFAIDTIQYNTGCKLHISIASETEIKAAINKYYSLTDSIDEVAESIDQIPTISAETIETLDISNTTDSDETSVIKLVNLVVLQAIKDNASDIHFEPDENTFRIRFRIDGILHEIFTPPKHLQAMIISRIKIMSDMDISERRIPQDGRFRLRIDGKNVDFRASVLPVVEGEKAVLRILDKTTSILDLDKAGFSDHNYNKWLSVIKQTEGIVLITGPTGSGKTTTLYAVLNKINSKNVNIVTVENPVEYQFPLINQVQINPKAGLTFSKSLRSILRQDPDIIMVGEIRDQETADIAIRSALTGHLVLSTLHTNDAPTAIVRLIDMGVEPFLVETSVIAVLAQRLVRRICPHCKTKTTSQHIDINNVKLTDKYYGKGCPECNNRGFQGRVAIHELLIIDEAIRKLITTGASSDTIRNAAKKNGMLTLREDGLMKAAKGMTTVEEVMRVSYF